MQAIVGRVQLKRLGEFVLRRQALAAIYDESLVDIRGLRTLQVPARVRHAQAPVTAAGRAVDALMRTVGLPDGWAIGHFRFVAQLATVAVLGWLFTRVARLGPVVVTGFGLFVFGLGMTAFRAA